FASVSLNTFFFLLLTRRLPRSTLFPYTTLFRSAGNELQNLPRVLAPDTGMSTHEAFAILEGQGKPVLLGSTALRHRVEAKDLPQDRKSTRLNSSHSQISYAVFCLKKKKTNTTTT